MKGVVRDLVLGIRLAVGGGRTSWIRFTLSVVGIGVATAILLLATSVPHAADLRQQRVWDSQPVRTPVAGVDPTYQQSGSTRFDGKWINLTYLRGTGPNSPRPPGLAAIPAEGEMIVSPALKKLLDSPEGEALRPRFPQKLVGTLPVELVIDPTYLVVYTGAGADIIDDAGPSDRVYGYGLPHGKKIVNEMLLPVLLGAAVLLIPVFVFIASSARVAGAERDRRLSALRLVGAGSRQVRRIAAAETLLGAVAGLLLGGGLFFLIRAVISGPDGLGGVGGYYGVDLVPYLWLGVIAVLAVPALAVLTAQIALRRTIIEPLGVVRQSKPINRRVLWRLAFIVVGIVLLLTQGGAAKESNAWSLAVLAGASLLLIGVPVLLPWALERVVGRIRGGPPSWQLAIRRLQLDSGTPARVVGGIAVMLAGAIALQALVLAQENGLGAFEEPRADQPRLTVGGDHVKDVLTAQAALRGSPGVLNADTVLSVQATGPGDASYSLSIGSCDVVLRARMTDQCTDGDVLMTNAMGSNEDVVPPDSTITFVESVEGSEEDSPIADWHMPAEVRQIGAREVGDYYLGTVIVTPGAVGDLLPELTEKADRASLDVALDPADPQAAVRAQNALGPLGWRIYATEAGTGDRAKSDQETFSAVRNSLTVGALFTLMLAGLSLLVLALEQIRERRRPLALLAATGIPLGALARSLVWQIVVPVLVGLVVAAATGIGLSWLTLRLADFPLTVDWGAVGLLCGAAVLLGVLTSLSMLPFLRNATKANAIRTE